MFAKRFFYFCAGVLVVLSSGCGKDETQPNEPTPAAANVVLIDSASYWASGNCQVKWILKNTGEKMAYHVWIEANTGSYFFEVNGSEGTLGPGESKDIRSAHVPSQCAVLVAIHWSDRP